MRQFRLGRKTITALYQLATLHHEMIRNIYTEFWILTLSTATSEKKVDQWNSSAVIAATITASTFKSNSAVIILIANVKI